MNRTEFQRQQEEEWRLFLRVFDNEDGKRVVEILKRLVLFNQPVFMSLDKQDRVDTHLAAYRDGRKSVVMQIEDMLKPPSFLWQQDEKPKQPKTK